MTPYTFRFQPVRLAQQAPPAPAPAPAPTSGQKKAAMGLGVLHTGFGVIATWVGVRAGMRETGLFSVMGYTVAVVGAIVTGVNLLGTLGMAQKS